jgi:hypothetical protein
MRTSRRPGGVPDELETEAIASEIARQVWTFDGAPWEAMTVSGSCVTTACTLELVGTRRDADGEDLWTFAIAPDEGRVEVVTSELAATPNDLAAALDALAHRLAPEGLLDGMLLSSAKWLPPPDTGAFALAYRSGNEEGSCEVDLVLDAVGGRIVLASDPC